MKHRFNIGKFRERRSEQRATLRKLQDKTGQSTQNLRRQNRDPKESDFRECFFKTRALPLLAAKLKKPPEEFASQC
ncbi:hypothetical protein LEP1GSC039_3949 [Leptospira santarosai str. 2000027870]|nr:hypothetical protein LEP1GSC039_3949 [Leptospira santarosai str. 2000027870]